MEGGSLLEQIKRKKFKEKEIVYIMSQLFKAMQHIHSLGIVHCNIRPENILFLNNEENLVRISDFGEAKMTNTVEIDTSISKNCFTPLYFAPEILSSKRLRNNYSLPCDIWSLGIVLYILCFDKAPFDYSSQQPNSSQMRQKIRDGCIDIDKSEFVSEDLVKVLRKMLKTSPDTRIKADELLKNNFFRIPLPSNSNEL